VVAKSRLAALAMAVLLPACAGAQTGFDADSLDRTIDPCSDFYRFACGSWLAANPVPADAPMWGRDDEVAARNQKILREILEAAANPPHGRDAVEQTIGDYYAACMDERAIETKGLQPVRADLERIAALADKTAIAAEIARLHGSGVAVLFRFGSAADFANAGQLIPEAGQGGLSLPDRDYYLRTDPKSAELRHAFRSSVARMFVLLGKTPARAADSTAAVLAIETALARASLDLVYRRDPAKVYHKMTRARFEALAPSFDWQAYLEGIGAPAAEGLARLDSRGDRAGFLHQYGPRVAPRLAAFDSLNVVHPDFYRGIEALLRGASLESWKAYLTWCVVHSDAPLLPAAFAGEDFAFFGKTLAGVREPAPRWKRCVESVDTGLGEALGRKFVEKTFGARGKQDMLAMVQALERALEDDIGRLDWMSSATRREALAKLHAIANKIGYPDRWRDYSSLEISRGDAIGNSRRARRFEFERRLARIGKPTDSNEWTMSPPTVDAYYSATMNQVNFPAGILQPPYYYAGGDDAVNYGAIGAVIGHELTHGFDDEGRRFDALGNLRDWWTPADSRTFDQRARCIAGQYGSYSVDGVNLSGALTLGENVADNGGLRIALMALAAAHARNPLPSLGGFTPEQRFFLGWGQIWCQNHTAETARLRARTDRHSPGQYRVNGVVSNMPEFRSAFGCREGQPMVRPNACRVW
jgi:putative endopeptidase